MSGKINTTKLSESQDYKDSPILKTLEMELGYTATHSMLSHISRTLAMSKQDILLDYETFSKVVKQIYGDAGEKHVLDKLPKIN